ncbi:hypothetical protein ACIOC2_19220 [Streptomyces sp. NPDC088337]|uniref:hypothetical protein n=1 Tax=unclassified Streptomyces TaxID=2593676 RepID=UPI0037F52D66
MPEIRHTPTASEVDALADAHLAVAQAAAALAEAEAVVAQRRYEHGLAVNELSKRINDVVYGPCEDTAETTEKENTDG